jgi:hypothetical protein
MSPRKRAPGAGRKGTLTPDQVRAARAALAAGATLDEVSAQIGKSRALAQKIKDRKVYAWVPDEDPTTTSTNESE